MGVPRASYKSRRQVPPAVVLYTDPGGGQILGYTEEHMRWALGIGRGDAVRLTEGQTRAVDAMILHGRLKSAAQALGIEESTLKNYLRAARQRAGCRTTLQLCMMYAWTGCVQRADGARGEQPLHDRLEHGGPR